MKICPNNLCKAGLPDSATFCPKCGTHVQATDSNDASRRSTGAPQGHATPKPPPRFEPNPTASTSVQNETQSSNSPEKSPKEDSPDFTASENQSGTTKKLIKYIGLGFLGIVVVISMFSGKEDTTPTNAVVATPKTSKPAAPSPSPAPVGSYHSLYVDRETWGWGAASSANNANPTDADQRAKNECEKITNSSGRCAKYSYGNAACYAVFYVPTRQQDRIMLKLGNTKEEALTNGKRECEQQSGASCELTGNVSC